MKQFSQAFRARLLLSSLLLCLSAAAQISGSAQPPESYKLIAVKVTGSKRFTQQEIADASGLPIGTVAHEEDFKKAARQLGETGAFGVINFTYTYSSAGTKLEFQVTDADKFVPAHFADFVWFTDEELRQKLHDRIPLFNGELPTNGRMPDQVSDVLQAMLVENGVPGRVEYQRTNGKDERLQSIDYSVAGVSIRIHHAEFPGAGSGRPAPAPGCGGKIIRSRVLPRLHGQLRRALYSASLPGARIPAGLMRPAPTQSRQTNRRGHNRQ